MMRRRIFYIEKRMGHSRPSRRGELTGIMFSRQRGETVHPTKIHRTKGDRSDSAIVTITKEALFFDRTDELMRSVRRGLASRRQALLETRDSTVSHLNGKPIGWNVREAVR